MKGRHTSEDLAYLRERGFAETAEEIERLHEVEDRATAGEKRDFVAEMASIWTEPTHDNLLKAAAMFLRSGNALHQVKVGDKMLTREEVAAGLGRYTPGPKDIYREMLDASDLHQA